MSNYNNQSLFSNHYLDNTLYGSDAWKRAFPQAQEFLAWLRDLYAQEKAQLAEYKESQLEDKWFKKIFEQLGHTWEGQAVIPAWKGNIKKPDFVFFPDEDARKTAVSLQNSTDYAKAALAVGEVKQWGISLDKNRVDAPVFDDKNPMYQIDSYLTLSKLEWGILSNGRQWRLLYRGESRSLDNYFEIDLLDMLEQPDEKKASITATYFWIFFNQDSFQADAQGQLLLRTVYDQSLLYKRELENDLRGNAYRALEQLILGFFNSNPTLDANNLHHRADVYHNSLYLLYRLLFLFYGESRALLPINNTAYQTRYSLQKIVKQLNRNAINRVEINSLPVTGRYYWHELSETFRLISGVDEALNIALDVPRYNGGLFDGQQHPFLENYIVGDYHLMQAIDYLATRRIESKSGKPKYETVDYATLDVRQLGSIYEGLLEYKVAVAHEEMVTISKKGVETWVPLAKKGKAKRFGNRRRRGELYLTTDKGERKATGSYYTPDYIVEYIVENTLSPLVAQIRENATDGGTFDGGAFADGILRLNVLDPAMGSGHFLVEAMEYLARVLGEGAGWTVTSEVTVTSADSVTSAPDLLYWKRRVVEACIYGVDKNPMAVELAKLSLWLKTAVADKPLSFLDHHLQHGDSLIGASLKDLSKSPIPSKSVTVSAAQKSLIDDSAFTRDVGLAVGGMMAIERATSDTIEDVHLKEKIWADLQEKHISAWRLLADVWVSTFFGNTMSREEYRALADRLQGRDSLMSDAQAERLLTHPAVTDNDYFHWNVMFPEVFFDELGRPLKEAAGFDAVVGNPPYVRQEVLSASKSFLQDKYAVYHSAADLYVYFMELAVRLLNKHAFCGVIVSHKFMRADYGMALRHLLTRKTTPQQIVHFSDLPVFDTVSAYPAIIQWQKGAQNDPLPTVLVAQFNEMGFEDDLKTAVNQANYSVSYIGLQDSGWTLRNGKITQLQRKIVAASRPLHEYVDGQIHYGIKTGFNQAFFIDRATHDLIVQSSPHSASLLKPLATGEDLQRYSVNNRGQFMIVIPAGWSQKQSGFIEETAVWEWLQNTHQALAAHLAPFAKQAKQRHDMGDFWWELRPCAYYAAFESPKIIYPVIAKNLRFSLDMDQFYGNDKTYIIPKEDPFLLALLNASLTGFFARFVLSGLRGDYLEFRASHFQNLPIYEVSFTTNDDVRTAVSQKFHTLYQQTDYAAIQHLAAAELADGRNDTIHDLLAFLAEQMIGMNKQKQAALEAFWLDLEGVAEPAAFDILRNKGKWEKSLHKAVPAARPFVNETSRSSVPLSASLSWNEEAFKGFVKLLVKKVRYFSTIVGVYREHKTAVSTIDRQLTATDRLIDQIVYQLYGLTDEEIRIVEG